MRIKRTDPHGLSFSCPGCGDHHVVTIPPWKFNGDFDKPTIRDSILVTVGHFVDGHQAGHCWCTYNLAHPKNASPFICYRCHSYVTDGRIEFLFDCSHALAGQAVDLPDISEAAQP